MLSEVAQGRALPDEKRDPRLILSDDEVYGPIGTFFSADRNVDLQTGTIRYKTFMWIKEAKASDALTRQRLVEEVNAALTDKGLKLVTSNADLGIAAHFATEEERTLNTFYNNFGGGWRWGGGFGSATTTEDTYEVGTLVIDLFDARTKEAVWRGTSSKTLSGKSSEECREFEQGHREDVQELPARDEDALKHCHRGDRCPGVDRNQSSRM